MVCHLCRNTLEQLIILYKLLFSKFLPPSIVYMCKINKRPLIITIPTTLIHEHVCIQYSCMPPIPNGDYDGLFNKGVVSARQCGV